MQSRSTLLPALAAAACLLAGCSSAPRVPYYVEPADGPTALIRVGGEGQISLYVPTKEEESETCFSWRAYRNKVLDYQEGVTKKPGASYPLQGKSLGMPQTAATRRYPDKNRWAEVKVPAGVPIEVQYVLPREHITSDAAASGDTALACTTGYRFVPEAGKMYQFAFSWGGMEGNRTCAAVVTTLPDEQILRVQRLPPCFTVDYENLLTIDGLTGKGG